MLICAVYCTPAARADFRALVSPGPLAAPHASLDRQCDKCHVPFKGIPDGNCLACHTRVATQLKERIGAHVLWSNKKCSACHRDHKGRDHILSPPVDEKEFRHEVTGIRLEGRHAKAPCTGCHTMGPRGPKRVGLPTTCAGCHADTHHRGALGNKCQSCHSPTGWATQLRAAADHKVPMTGKHAGLACAACHKGGSHIAAKLGCDACHEQQHGGTKAPCESCHNPADWKKATHQHDFCTCILPGKHQTAPCLSCHPNFRFSPNTFECAACHRKDLKHEPLGACSLCHSALSWKKKAFDHNKKVVGFPIEGKHLEVGCENCHTRPGIFRGAPTACEGCHKVPKHGDFGGCATCHTTGGFGPPQKFSHEKTRFPIDGAHRSVACETCHARFAKGTFVPGPNACALCHGDPHKGQFNVPVKAEHLQPPRAHARLAPDDGAPGHAVSRKWSCLDCHTSRAWKPSTVDVARHARFGFELRGAHARLDCARCHGDGQFVGTPTRCASCHTDFHGGRLGADCQRCHSENAFRPAPGFDHRAQTGFALEGAHAKRACEECHGDGTRDRLADVPRPVGCAACHTPGHGKQFGTDCTGCHRPTRFTDVPRFDHAARTFFPLERRHATIACAACHDTRRFGERLHPACATCHGDPHFGSLGRECGDCHRADRWLLVRFDHDRTEFPLRGRHFVAPCARCHRNNLWTGLRTECVTCHAKDRPTTMLHPKRWDCNACHVSFGWHTLTQ